MKSLSLKLDDAVFEATESLLKSLKQKRKLLFEQLRKDSDAVREESMKVLYEFEPMNDEATAV